MDEKPSPDTWKPSWFISIHSSPSRSTLSISSKDRLTLTLTFTLNAPCPLTLFNLDTILCPTPGGYTFLHHHFTFTDTSTGTTYEPGTCDLHNIIHHRNYELSYSNAHNLTTLYPDVPYTVTRHLRPGQYDQEPMQVGHSYRMQLSEYAERQNLWWSWGRKWQVLRWRGWPFGEVKDVGEFVVQKEGLDRIGEVQFVWEGDCVITVTV